MALADTPPNCGYMVSLQIWISSDDFDITPIRGEKSSYTPLVTRHGGLNAGHRIGRLLNPAP